jgi:hypothetical protein
MFNSQKTSLNTEAQATVQTDVWRVGTIAFAVAIAAWIIFLYISPPRIPGGDVTCFKDPGINLAQGRGLVELVTPGNPTLTPKFYANYPPLFPAIYGIYVSQFGVSGTSDEIFDLILSAGGAVLFWFFVTPRNADRCGRIPSLILLGILIMMLPVGPFWTQRERPDSLGLIVMMASLWVARSRLTPKRAFIATFIAGIGCLISPFTFVMNGIALGWIILLEGGPILPFSGPRTTHLLTLMIAAILGVIIPFASLFIIQWFNDPDSVARFVGNAMGKSTAGRAGTGYFASLMAGDFSTYFGAFSRFDSFRYKWMLAHLLFVSALTTLYLVQAKTPRSLLQVLATITLALFPLIVFPYQPCYMSLTAAMVLILFDLLDGKAERKALPSNRWVTTAGIAFIALVATPFMLREFVIAFDARDSFQKTRDMIQKFASDPNRPKPIIATSSGTYFLFKQAGFETVEIAYLQRPEDIARVDVFAINTSDESDGAKHKFPSWWVADKMEPIHLATKEHNGVSNPDIKLFGVSVFRRELWEPVLFRHKQ